MNETSRHTRALTRSGLVHKGFSAQCDNCEKHYFKSDIREVRISKKSGEVGVFSFCPKCRVALQDRIDSDAGRIYGITGDTVKSINRMLHSAASASNESRGRKAFVISFDDIAKLWIIQDGKCAASGATLDEGGDWDTRPSLDRIDSDGPYKMGNIQIVTAAVNRAKNVLTMEEFVDMCRRVAAHKSNQLDRAA